MHTLSRTLAGTVLLLAVVPSPAATQQDAALQLARFNAVEVDGGAHVIIRPGPAQRVTMTAGSAEYSRVRVTGGGELVIEKCRSKCPKGYVLEVDVVTPGVGRIVVENGGRIRVQDTFPRRTGLGLEVSHGGTIDARSIAADRVTASIYQGGGILTVANTSLIANIANGGHITYWGDAQVRSSVERGGAVVKGKPGM